MSTSAAEAPVAEAPVQARHAAAIAVSGETYTVQDGDTLSKIAHRLPLSRSPRPLVRS